MKLMRTGLRPAALHRRSCGTIGAVTIVALANLFQVGMAFADDGALTKRQEHVTAVKTAFEEYKSIRGGLFLGVGGAVAHSKLFATESEAWAQGWSPFRGLIDDLKAGYAAEKVERITALLRSQSSSFVRVARAHDGLARVAAEGESSLLAPAKLPESSDRFGSEIENLRASRQTLLEAFRAIRESSRVRLTKLDAIQRAIPDVVGAFTRRSILTGATGVLADEIGRFLEILEGEVTFGPSLRRVESLNDRLGKEALGLWIFQAAETAAGLESSCVAARAEFERITDLGEAKANALVELGRICSEGKSRFANMKGSYSNSQLVQAAQKMRIRGSRVHCSASTAPSCEHYLWLSGLSERAITAMDDTRLKKLEDAWRVVEMGGRLP